MAASIVLTGLSMSDPVPGQYLEILFNQGPAAGFAGQRPILLIGNKTTAGSGTAGTVVYGPDTQVPVQTEQDVINVTGTGSELHRMWRRAQPVAKNTTSIYLIIVAESGGTAASKQFTLLNAPTGAGTVRCYVGDEFAEYSFAASDTLASISSGMTTAINSKTHWAVTSAQSTSSTSNDSWTITARQKGPRGNWIRAMATITFGSGATPNTTLTGGTDAFLTSGATADDNTTALGTIASSRYYYTASAAEDATQFGALVTQVNLQALPVTGLRQCCFAGSVDTQANVDTVATGLNAVRSEVIWCKNGLWTPSEMAAFSAAVYAVEENSGDKPKCNFSGYPRNDSEAALWSKFPAPRDQTAWPSRATVKTALLNGVTPIGVNTNGSTYLVKRITTKCLNGSNPDYRARDSHIRTVLDFMGDDMQAQIASDLGGKNLTDDTKQGAEPPPADTTTPARYRSSLNAVLTKYANKGLLQKIDTTRAQMIVQREAANPNRMSASVGAYPCAIFDQGATQILQLG